MRAGDRGGVGGNEGMSLPLRSECVGVAGLERCLVRAGDSGRWGEGREDESTGGSCVLRTGRYDFDLFAPTWAWLSLWRKGTETRSGVRSSSR